MRLIVAGGGTGGHLYPGLAVADEVRRRGGEVLFVGTARGIEARAVPAAGYPLELLQVSGLKRMGLAGKLKGISRLPLAGWQSQQIIRRFAPTCVLGVGGYASGPLVMMAALLGVPTTLQEQNSAAGFTNKALGRFARKVFLGFPEAASAFPATKCVHTGNPVRTMFNDSAVPSAQEQNPRRGGVLVVGGSQGARAVNEIMVLALAKLAASGVRPPVLHQAGKLHAETVAAAYAQAGLTNVTVRAFIDNMPEAYAGADLVIGRAGALTLAELAIVGRASLLIPLPTAADDHQTRNAQSFAAAGAAMVYPESSLSPETLASALLKLLGDPTKLAQMEAACKTLARPRAAAQIVDELEILQRQPVSPS